VGLLFFDLMYTRQQLAELKGVIEKTGQHHKRMADGILNKPLFRKSRRILQMDSRATWRE
jgi:hypothetical protein